MDDADNNEGYPQDESGALVEGRRRKREPEVSEKKREAMLNGMTKKKKKKEMEENPLVALGISRFFTAALAGKKAKKNMQSRPHQREMARRGFGKKELPFVTLTRKTISVQDFE